MSTGRAAAAGRELELLDDALSADQQRLSDGLACLRDSVDRALEVVAWLEYIGTGDDRSASQSGSWAYCVCRAGVRFETVDAIERVTAQSR